MGEKNPLLSILIFKADLIKVFIKVVKIRIQIKDIILRIQKPTKVLTNFSLFLW